MSKAEIIQVLMHYGFIFLAEKELCMIFRHAECKTEHELFFINHSTLQTDKYIEEKEVRRWANMNNYCAQELMIKQNSLCH